MVIGHIHELSEDARDIGAVNTVVFRDGRRIGHNTDWPGFAQGFERDLPGARSVASCCWEQVEPDRPSLTRCFRSAGSN